MTTKIPVGSAKYSIDVVFHTLFPRKTPQLIEHNRLLALVSFKTEAN